MMPKPLRGPTMMEAARPDMPAEMWTREMH